jgi:pilus assembly protein CpaE
MADGKKVLLVINSETLLRMHRFYFTREGYEVESAKTAEGALKHTANDIFDGIIADENLPGVDGLAFIRQLRASPLTVHLPVLLLSGNPADVKIQALVKGGTVDAIRRDAKVEEVGARLAKLLTTVDAAPRDRRLSAAAHTITILSSRGGSGKTFLSTNLGVALAQRQGETAVLADLNLEFGTTAMMLDLRPVYTLRDIAEAALGDVSDQEFDAMLLRHSSGLRLLPAVAQPGDSELIPEGSLPRIMERLRRLYDHVIVDGRPSFREFMLDLWENSNTLLIMCPPEVISVLVTRTLLEAFSVVNVDPEKALIVLNHVAAKARLTPQQVERGLNRSTFVIPHGGDELHRSVDVGKAFVTEYPNHPAAIAIKKLSEQLVQRFQQQGRRAP